MFSWSEKAIFVANDNALKICILSRGDHNVVNLSEVLQLLHVQNCN